MVLAVPGIVMVAVAVSSSVLALRISLSLAAVVMFGAVALAWSGFRYVFTNLGLEIRTLGFTLLSIRSDEIRDYRIDKWNVAGGYGIRGLGRRSRIRMGQPWCADRDLERASISRQQRSAKDYS